MNIGIFGRHPIPQPGFMGVMSLFEAVYLSRQGHRVTLILPFLDPASLQSFCATHGIANLDALDRNGCEFAIIPIFQGTELAEKYDVMIYQSYDWDDYQTFFAALRRASTVMTKNFPKFVPGTKLAMHETVESSCKEFDLVACALKEDVDELRGNPQFWEQYGAQIAYVPRGADQNLLHPGRKLGSRPTVVLEIPFTEEGRAAVDFYIEPLRLLQVAMPDVRVMTLGVRPHPDIRAEHVYYGRFDEIYERVFNEAWLYLIMDYKLSSVHVKAPVQQLHPGDWSARAIYEVQNIEAQMAGGIIIGHPSNTIPELLRVGASAFYFRDYADAPQIARLMLAAIANFPMLSVQARDFALSNFTWESCMARWATAMEGALKRRRAAIG